MATGDRGWAAAAGRLGVGGLRSCGCGLEVEGAGEQGVAVQAGGVAVGDGVDDEFVDVEGVGHGGEVVVDFFGCADEVAGPLVLQDGQRGSGRAGEGFEFAEGIVGCGDRAAVALADAALEEADARVEVLGLLLGVGADDADGGGGLGGGEPGAGGEAVAVVLDGLAGVDGGEEVSEGVGQAELGGGGGAPEAGAEQPDRGMAGAGGR